MVEIHIAYGGELHCVAKHRPSGSSLATDAPVDNHGRGETFSPTDLVATALGSCMLTVMGILANKRGWALDGIGVHVRKEMTRELPRKIARLSVDFSIPTRVKEPLDDAARRELEHAARTCPVRLSIAESIDVPIRFDW